tara:strand:+ start:241 stop:390 length:150 start_codon:yes stop_codon:yes gene_type:complete
MFFVKILVSQNSVLIFGKALPHNHAEFLRKQIYLMILISSNNQTFNICS